MRRNTMMPVEYVNIRGAKKIAKSDWKDQKFPDADFILAVKLPPKNATQPFKDIVTLYTNGLDIKETNLFERKKTKDDELLIPDPGDLLIFTDVIGLTSFCTSVPRWIWI
jgi:hypothetical protein